ncbi:MAG: hypothetical protein Q9P44_08500 [Anaerolineae bacterium]|nr:hypothetical protein [Anaerolineae bacterium]
MAFELEALVGHLYIAGGRTIKTTPPGSLCEVAPKKAARGREIDTFFVLVIPSGVIAPNTFYEQMALMAAERYFSQTGSVTSALRDVFNTLNNNLFEHNAAGRKHYEASMIIAVLRSQDLYVARAGAATLVLRYSGETKTIPENLTDDDKLFKAPLGVQPIPDIEMSRYPVDEGTRLMLCDANITEITKENITQSLLAAHIEQVLDDLKALVTLQVQMMVVEFVAPDIPVMIPAATGQSTAVLQAEIAAARVKVVQDEAIAKAHEKEIARRNTPQARIKQRLIGGSVSVARSTGHTLTAIGNLTGKLIGTESSPKQARMSATFMMTAVIGLPVVVIAIVMLSWVFNVGQTAFEDCVTNAVAAANTARVIDSNNPAGVLAAWQGTQTIVGDCDELRPDNNDPQLRQIAQEAQSIIDRLNGIDRRNATIIYAFPDADISRLILQGLDIYAFDNTANITYRLTLRDDGMGAAGTHQIISSMAAGSRIESLGVFVGDIISIDFDEQRTQLIALDENGILISCSPRFVSDCDFQRLLGAENWINPTQITMWQGNLYVMDAGSDQLWRYEPISGTNNYASPPTEYFTGSIRYELDNAVDFTIGNTGSTRGAVFILYEDGTMTHHLGGDPIDFAFSGFRDGLELSTASVQSMFLNDDPIDTGFYFVSRPTRTIYETTAAGTFRAAYRVQDETLFERITQVVADAGEGIVYVASGNTILAFNK